jgi:hypothetical protein
MEFEVEDGTGVAGATAYITAAYLYEYAAATGQVPGSGDPQGAIIRATTWIDTQFGTQFSGTRTNGRDQGLAWPRTDATDVEGTAIADDEVPTRTRQQGRRSSARSWAA